MPDTRGSAAARPRTDATTLAWRTGAIAFAVLSGLIAAALMAAGAVADGASVWDWVSVGLIFVTTLWLGWGAAQAMTGLLAGPARRAPDALAPPTAPTVVLLPLCNEDPKAAAARLAAMEASCRAAGVRVDFAILSDTRDPDARARERRAFAPLLTAGSDRLSVYYRTRPTNEGRKAGNIEDFVRRSGGAYDFAVVLDADSLMEGATIGHLISRMQADPNLGLLQTLPKIIAAHSAFGRAMQFAASFYSPVFARGLGRLQGTTGPFWGHNAILRLSAVADSCGLPELAGPPPFGGPILSHDYVEAALLARAGWRVEVDPEIGGSFEEGPDNLVAYARRDRRWCQGNLQHIRLLDAPGFRAWSRFVFVQGIVSYLVSILWAAFLIASVAAAVVAPAPDYFPEPHQLFPVFPDQSTREIIALAIGIGGLLLLPKFAILGHAIATARAPGFGGRRRSALSVVGETLLSSAIAPVMLMFQTKAVCEVLIGRDGGWPANLRGEGRLDLADGWRAAGWIAGVGALALGAVVWIAPGLIWWLLPVTGPMMAAPLLVAATSRGMGRWLFAVPQDHDAAGVVAGYYARVAAAPDPAPTGQPRLA